MKYHYNKCSGTIIILFRVMNALLLIDLLHTCGDEIFGVISNHICSIAEACSAYDKSLCFPSHLFTTFGLADL